MTETVQNMRQSNSYAKIYPKGARMPQLQTVKKRSFRLSWGSSKNNI